MAKAKEVQGLDCAGDAVSNIKLIVRARVDEICALREKALDWSDIEGVHDMRVATRRLRSALRDFAPYIDEKKSPRKTLRDMARILGAVRDEDVAILALEKLRAKAQADIAHGINLLIEERRARQAAARERLQTAINEAALDELQERFTIWLNRATGDDVRSVNESKLTFKRAGQETILSRYRELENLSRSLYHPFDVEPLHLMRIAAKRLRYAIELFSFCFGAELSAFAEEISELQTALGELHDCDVWIADLGARLAARGVKDDAHRDGRINDSHEALRRRAAFHLLQHFTEERTGYFRDALALWAKWEATNFYSRLQENLQAAARPSLLYNQISP